jgi:putative addiction module component (TIGR02574 family)
MTHAVDELVQKAMSLSESERHDLLLALLNKLMPARADDELLTDELKQELDRRIDHFDAHPESGVPMNEAHRIARERLKARATR